LYTLNYFSQKLREAELNDAKKAIRKLPFEVVRLFTKI